MRTSTDKNIAYSRAMKSFAALLTVVLLTGCLGYPEQVEPVDNFELESYLGTWYEIARLDHSFERGLTRVTADYSRREGGGIKVITRGFSAEENTWKTAEGKAFFVEDGQTGYLKVSFFGPFYSSYVIFELDDDYQYAFIAGANHDYLWLLSRTPDVSNALVERFEREAQARGFDTSELVIVEH